jgi:hypothetical protein
MAVVVNSWTETPHDRGLYWLVGQPDVAAGGWRCLVDGLSCALPSSRPPPVAAARPPFSAAKA